MEGDNNVFGLDVALGMKLLWWGYSPDYNLTSETMAQCYCTVPFATVVEELWNDQ